MKQGSPLGRSGAWRGSLLWAVYMPMPLPMPETTQRFAMSAGEHRARGPRAREMRALTRAWAWAGAHLASRSALTIS